MKREKVNVDVPDETDGTDEADKCVAGVDSVVSDSACYKKLKREEEVKRQNQCKKPPGSSSIADSACY